MTLVNSMRVLFASMPFDGHLGPVLGVAAHFAQAGHEVAVYTGPSYATKLQALGLRHFPYRRAKDVNTHNLVEHVPEYANVRPGPKQIEIASTQIFFANCAGHFDDVREIQREFAFDAFVADGALYAAYLVRQKLSPNVFLLGPGPTPAPRGANSPPPFFGLRPATNPVTRVWHRVVESLIDRTNRRGVALFEALLAREGLPPLDVHVFDLPCRAAVTLFQSGCPGMDFPRDDWPANYRFVGPLLPPRRTSGGELGFADLRAKHEKLVVISQGTVDNREPAKLFVPALEALAGGPHLVVATTGGSHTAELRARFSHSNVIIEDWIDYDQLMAEADVFVSNGGYGSVMHALLHGVPVVSAGKLEAKNDINARLAFRGLAIDLDTERPTPKQVAAGVARALVDTRLREHVERVRDELRAYRPYETIEADVSEHVRAAAAAPGRARSA